MMAGAGASPYELASDAASRLGIAVGAEELATLASDLDLGDGEMAAVAATFSYLAEKRRLASIETLLRLSRLPWREPKTFEGFDFSRIQGRDAAALGKLPSLADLYAHRNVAFVGPGGIGKTHLAQAWCSPSTPPRARASGRMPPRAASGLPARRTRGRPPG